MEEVFEKASGHPPALGRRAQGLDLSLRRQHPLRRKGFIPGRKFWRGRLFRFELVSSHLFPILNHPLFELIDAPLRLLIGRTFFQELFDALFFPF